jgi:hypothetical protein
LNDIYAPKETMIGELTGGILAPIQREQVRVVKDGHLDVAVQYDVGKLGSRQFIWIIAPTNPGAYSLIIRDVIALVNGVPEVIEYRKDFSVQGAIVDYSVGPGFILADEDFEISAIAYTGTDIETDFPEQRTISLYPGTNYVDFSIEDVLGVQMMTINFGMYQIPAYILGNDYICGDGRIDDREVCDGTELGGKDCTNYDPASQFVSGELKCSSSCLVFDTSLCELPATPIEEECDSEHLSLCLNQTDCVGAGGYWYNNTCNRYEQGAVCDSGHVGLCTTQGTCLDAGGYWYNNTCNEDPAPVCSSEHFDLCKTQGTCLDAGGYWYNNTCNENEEVIGFCGDGIIGLGEECDGTNVSSKNCSSLGFDFGNLSCISANLTNECRFNLTECYFLPPPAPPAFTITPWEIKSTVLLSSGFPVYKFRITNDGSDEIIGLQLDYNPSKFSITPYSNINLSANESVDFNISVRDVWRGTPFKGVIIAYSEDVYEYFLLDINFTESESEAITHYYRNGTSSGPSSYCSEISGVSCGSGETCDGYVVTTIDVEACCVGSCESQSSGFSSMWIGYLIAGIVILGGIIVYMRFKKAGKPSGSPLQSKILQAKTNLP